MILLDILDILDILDFESSTVRLLDISRVILTLRFRPGGRPEDSWSLRWFEMTWYDAMSVTIKTCRHWDCLARPPNFQVHSSTARPRFSSKWCSLPKDIGSLSRSVFWLHETKAFNEPAGWLHEHHETIRLVFAVLEGNNNIPALVGPSEHRNWVLDLNVVSAAEIRSQWFFRYRCPAESWPFSASCLKAPGMDGEQKRNPIFKMFRTHT